MKHLWQQLAIATNWPILAAVAVLCSLGILSIWADNPEDATKQTIFLGVAFLCMTLFQVVNYQKIGRWAWAFYLGSLSLVFYTVMAAARGAEDGAYPLPLVKVTKGACAWLDFGPVHFEPSEITKIAFVLVLARYLRFRSNYRTLKGLLPPFALALVPVGMIMKQPDLGVASLFVPTLFAMLFVAGAKIKHLLGVVALGIACLPVMWYCGQDTLPNGEICQSCPHLPVLRHFPQFVKHYQRQRVYAMLSHDASMQDLQWQQERALMAMHSGGLTGQGLGKISVAKTVPERHNDMIIALIGEQFGLVGIATLLAAYIVLFAAGVEIAAATKEPFGKLVAVGIVAILATQTFVNLMVAMRMMPVTGITLPFVSYGGSSLVSSFMAVGLLLNIGQNRPVVIARTAFEFD